MSAITRFKKVAVAAGAVSLLAGAAVAVTAGAASAAPASTAPYTYTVCANGDYNVYFEIPQENDYRKVQQGACTTVSLNSGTSYAKIWGYWNASSEKFYVGTGHFKAADGGFANAGGTTANPSLFTNPL